MTGTPRDHTAMASTEPDFFIHSGDTVYADGPLEETDGQVRGHPPLGGRPSRLPGP